MTEIDKLYFDGRHIITPYIEELQGKFHAPGSGDITCGSPIYAEEQFLHRPFDAKNHIILVITTGRAGGLHKKKHGTHFCVPCFFAHSVV